MPNLITHTIFCEEVYKGLSHTPYQELISRYVDAYRLGSNGPDFLYFYDRPYLWRESDKVITKIGSAFHNGHVNAFYACAIDTCHSLQGEKKDILTAYVLGHYLHWQLDSVLHPYIVYRTGFKKRLSKEWHQRFEANMDTLFLKQYRHTTIRSYKMYHICDCPEEALSTITAFYQKAIATCLNQEITTEVLKKAFVDWRRSERLLYDPHGLRFPLVKLYERLTNQPWRISSTIIPAHAEEGYDVMNTAHTVWHHPCTNEASMDSAPELFQKAYMQSMQGLALLWEALETKDEATQQAFLQFLGDRTYANGISGKAVRKYKDVVYNKKKAD